ncbi:MAG: hypothetical protein ACUZ9M_01190 [Candidatus Scalindua sp.]
MVKDSLTRFFVQYDKLSKYVILNEEERSEESRCRLLVESKKAVKIVLDAYLSLVRI